MAEVTVAALYVDPRGPYPRLLGAENCWGEKRDARLYDGPWPVVAHPPCERWGRYWGGGPTLARTDKRKQKGDDGGCFAAALHAVRTYGGVLEHPEASAAWDWFGILRPPYGGHWVNADFLGGFTCYVEQGHYGHRARKGTWLYACHVRALEPAVWGKSSARARLDDGYHSTAERRKAARRGTVSRLTRLERLASPVAFAEYLVRLARSVQR